MDKLKLAAGAATLLIVEDDMLPAMLLKAELEDAGYNVLDLTSHPDHALSSARECKPHLAMVNIELHGRDDGIELAREFKTMGIPVLFISGQISRARTAQTVAVGSLPKPYHPADMVLAVGYLLARLSGDGSPEKPDGLEVFDDELAATDPDPGAVGFVG